MTILSHEALERLLEVHAPFQPLPFVPSLSSWHTTNELPLWEALEAATGQQLPPPFFALAWPAGQALARLVLDGTIPVAGQRVADVGCGSGPVALAAARVGATVTALDLDPLALTACELAARRHGVSIVLACRDAFLAPEALEVDIVLAADLVYHKSQVEPGLRALAFWRERSRVVVADGGRPHFDAIDHKKLGLSLIAELDVPAERKVEGATERRVRIFSS